MERPSGDFEEVAVDIAEANIGQLSQGCKPDLLGLLRGYRDRELFPVIPQVLEGIKEESCFTSIDLASRFTKLQIAEEDKHKIAFRDAHGTLWELNRCGLGLKTLPAGFATFVGGALGSLKGKGVYNWLDIIVLYTQQVEGHLSLWR